MFITNNLHCKTNIYNWYPILRTATLPCQCHPQGLPLLPCHPQGLPLLPCHPQGLGLLLCCTYSVHDKRLLIKVCYAYLWLSRALDCYTVVPRALNWYPVLSLGPRTATLLYPFSTWHYTATLIFGYTMSTDPCGKACQILKVESHWFAYYRHLK